MTRVHGRSGVAYLARSYGDAASPVAFLSDWTVTYTRTVFDATVITDSQLAYGTGTTDASGGFSGFFDTATAQSYAAAVDGLPRDMFLYPRIADAGVFFSGPVLPDYSIGGGVTSAVSLSVKWAGAGPVILTRSGLYAAAYAAVYA